MTKSSKFTTKVERFLANILIKTCYITKITIKTLHNKFCFCVPHVIIVTRELQLLLNSIRLWQNKSCFAGPCNDVSALQSHRKPIGLQKSCIIICQQTNQSGGNHIKEISSKKVGLKIVDCALAQKTAFQKNVIPRWSNSLSWCLC